MKKRFILLLVLCLLMSCLVSCGDGSSQKDPSVTLGGTQEEQVKYDEWGREIIYSPLPEEVRFDNETVTFLARDNVICKGQYENSEANADQLNDAVFKRNMQVEERLNVSLAFKYTEQGDGNAAYNTTISKMVMYGQSEVDIASAFAYYSSTMLYQGFYYNLLEVDNLYLDQPWWNTSYIEEGQLYNQLYLLVGDLSLSMIQNTFCIFFNKTMLETWYPDRNLYEAVKNKEWTEEYFLETVKGVYADTRANNRVDKDDTFGLVTTFHSFSVDAFFAAYGLRVCTKNADGIPEITLNTLASQEAYEKTYNLLYDTNGVYTTDATNEGVAEARKAFLESRALFSVDMLRTGAEFSREMEPNTVGVLPLYMGGEGQKEYATTPQDSYDALAILSNVGERADLCGAVLEMMCYYSYRSVRPEYFETVVKIKYSSGSEDATMYDIIINSVYYDYGMINSYAISRPNLGHLWRTCLMNGTINFNGAYKANEGTYSLGLTSYIQYFLEIAPDLEEAE